MFAEEKEVVAEEWKSPAGEAGRQAGFARAGASNKGDRTLADGDRAGVKDEGAIQGEDMGYHLVE